MKRLLLFLVFVICKQTFAQTDDSHILVQQLANARTTKEKFGVIYRMCEYYGNHGKVDSMRIQSSRLLDMANKEKDDSLLIRAYVAVNGFYWVTGNFPLSIEYSFKAINLAEKTGNYRVCAGATSNVAWAYFNLKNYPKALELSLKAVDFAKRLPDGDKFFMMAYDNVAGAYIELGETDSALRYTQLANAISIKLKDTYAQTSILDDFGRTYEMLNDYELAESYYKKSIALSTLIKARANKSVACIHYSRLLLKQHKTAEAKSCALTALQEAVTSNARRQTIESSELLQLLYEQEHRTDSAYYYLKTLNIYRDSAFNEQRTFQVQVVTFNQQLYENEVRQQENEEAEARRTNLQYAAIGIGLVTFLILFLFFSYSIIANQKTIRFLGVVLLLLVFELINLYLHPYIGALTHHAPLLMLLIMVCMAALLVPFHHKLEHWLTQKMVEKNNRVRLTAAKKIIAKLQGNVHTVSDEKSINAQKEV